MAIEKQIINLAVCQMKVEKNKRANLSRAEELIRQAKKTHCPDIIVLPEMFNCPFNHNYFGRYAESFPGETTEFLSALANELKTYIVGGSIPEAENGKLFNTSYTFDRNGEIAAKHRKIHLFDVNIKNGISFKESKYISPGDRITVFDTDFCRIGVAICYDMRYPELIRKMTLDGARLIIIPAAFNMTTGPAHWHITARTRALDNQIYFVCASPARDISSDYTVYGHSIITDPWGQIISEAAGDETIIYGKIELKEINRIRNELPLIKHRRPGIYKD
ncbi:MAG: carbon-nitrogen hydrolase family protein [Actinomycetia bacterium]|nr:carbon-nitrogen hydrolase family protein [Actinomycetes bacterium]